MKRFWIYRIKAADLTVFAHLGWSEVARERIPSIADEVLLIRWDGEGEPPVPPASAPMEAFDQSMSVNKDRS